MKTYKHLAYDQQCQIYALKKSHLTQQAIADIVGVSQTTISRDLKRVSKGSVDRRLKLNILMDHLCYCSQVKIKPIGYLKMKLYGVGKSRSFRALWALEEAGIEYEYISVKFGSSDENGSASEEYKTLNPQGKVPTLVDGGLVVTESGAILNYIAANSPKLHLIPSNDLKRRAKYDEVCYFVLSELEQGLWTNGKHRFALPEAQRVSDILPTATWEFNKAIKTLQSRFSGEGFVLGDEFTMADVLLAQTLDWAERFEFDVPDNLLSYKNKMYYRKGCKNALEKLEEAQ